MQVGKQVRSSTIKEKNLSQDDLAEITFVSRQSISNWERGANHPRYSSKLQALLSKVFEVSLDQLIKVRDVETMNKLFTTKHLCAIKDGGVSTILPLKSYNNDSSTPLSKFDLCYHNVLRPVH